MSFRKPQEGLALCHQKVCMSGQNIFRNNAITSPRWLSQAWPLWERRAGVHITDLRNMIHFDWLIIAFTSQTVRRGRCNALATSPATKSVRTLWASLMGSSQLQRSPRVHCSMPIASSEGIVLSWKTTALERRLRNLPTIRQQSLQTRGYGLAATLSFSSMDKAPPRAQ